MAPAAQLHTHKCSSCASPCAFRAAAALPPPSPPPGVQVVYLGYHLPSSHVPSLLLAGSCLGLMVAWPKAWAKVLPPQVRH